MHTRRSILVVDHDEDVLLRLEYAHAVLSKWGPEVAERVRQLFPPAQASA
jgi:hypothetical protein